MNPPLSLHSGKLSLFQSAVNKILHEKKGQAAAGLAAEDQMMQQANTVLAAAQANQDLSKFIGTPLECASLAVQAALAFAAGNRVKEAQIRAQLQDSPCDAGWLTSLAAFEAYYLSGKSPQYMDWKNLGDYVYPMAETGRQGEALTVGVLADWGTGDPAVARSSLAALFRFQPDLIVHLGDIYYAGTPEECTNNFLNYLVKATEENYRLPIYNLAGNHDYYSGGGGYYALLAKLNPQCAPPGTPVQQASFFCLRNANWQIQAMDTGYGDHDVFTVADDITQLQPREVTWHQDKIDTAAGRKIILFSHHQLYSAFINIGKQGENYYNPNLLQSFQAAMNSGAITSWFWGHEHLLEIYGPSRLLGKAQPIGRCIGYSAFPMLTSEHPYNVVTGAEKVPLVGQPPYLGTTKDVYNHGFVILTLAAKFGRAEYYQIPGDGSPAPDPLAPSYSEDFWTAQA